jgi:hypothetical protein
MKHRYMAGWLLGLAAMAGTAARAGTVDVAFTHPETYADVRDSNRETSPNLATIALYLQGLGARYLPAEQSLHVEVLDVDLAGKLRSSFRWGMVRVLGGPLDWPRMTLRYQLEEHGRVLASGEETLSDMAYATHLGSYPSWEALGAEKRMLRDWFRSRFAVH